MQYKLSKHQVIFLLIIVWIFFLVVLAWAAWTLNAGYLTISFEKGNSYTVEYKGKFTPPSPEFVLKGELIKDIPVNAEYEIDSKVDTSAIGLYTVKYTSHWKLWDAETFIIVNVTDSVPPVIQLMTTGNTGEISWLTGYDEEGYTAIDNCDGDITDKVRKEVHTDKIIYTVKDSSGNETSVARSLTNVLEPPTFYMNGFEEQTVYASRHYSDPGCTATDGLGNDLTKYIVCEGEVIPYTPGDYEIKYSIENFAGDVASAVRTIHVIPVSTVDMEKPAQKTIYLTFDDGPSPYTEELLNILDKYNAKVTFFVTGNQEYRNMIGEAYRRGHAIGVHSYSHEYYEIYSSEDAFFNDFYKVQEIIMEQTGEYTKLLRFPGGSSNTVSNFNPGIMSRLARQLTDMGYYYYDWNIVSGDAGETTKTSVLKQNVIDGCSGFNYPIVLQHDIKLFSVKAVEDILIWGHNNGYVFSALSESSPSAHHGINN